LPIRVSVENNRSDGSLRDGPLVLGGDDNHGTLRVTDKHKLGLRTSAKGGRDSAGEISGTLSGSGGEVGGGPVASKDPQSSASASIFEFSR